MCHVRVHHAHHLICVAELFFRYCPSPSAHEDNKSDIQQEIDILCTLKRGDCSNVVKMFDFGWDETGGRVTIVMEHVEYGSLVSYLRWSGAKLEVSYSDAGTIYQNQMHDIIR